MNTLAMFDIMGMTDFDIFCPSKCGIYGNLKVIKSFTNMYDSYNNLQKNTKHQKEIFDQKELILYLF